MINTDVVINTLRTLDKDKVLDFFRDPLRLRLGIGIVSLIGKYKSV